MKWNRLFPERSFAYLSKMYSSNLKAGEPFSHANKCVGINIIEKGFNLTDEIHSRGLFTLENTNLVLTDAITMHFLNLARVKDLPITSGKTREEQLINWAKMIYTNKKEERRMLATTSPIFKLLNEKIEEIVRSPEEQRRFDSRMKMRSDIVGGFEAKCKEGKAEGIKEGMRQKRKSGRSVSNQT